MTEKTKTFGYIRVSTDKQAEKGYSLDDQEKRIRAHCKQNNLELVDIFKDKGYSGADFKRPGLMRLIASSKEVPSIVVVKTDRLWREDLAKTIIQLKLKKSGADVSSIEQPTYSIYKQGSSTDLVNCILEAIDQYERDSINEKMSRGRIQKAKTGVKGSGSAPLGYRWASRNKKSILIIDELQARTVKEIFAKYHSLKSLEKVRQYLDERGLKTARGKNFSTMGINKILRNRFYIGELKWGEVKTDGAHDSIISSVVFGRVQAMLNRNSKHKKAEDK
jgi:site-specific DNA recombinase